MQGHARVKTQSPGPMCKTTWCTHGIQGSGSRHKRITGFPHQPNLLEKPQQDACLNKQGRRFLRHEPELSSGSHTHLHRQEHTPIYVYTSVHTYGVKFILQLNEMIKKSHIGYRILLVVMKIHSNFISSSQASGLFERTTKKKSI